MSLEATSEEQLRAVIDAFRSNGGDGKPMFLQVHLAFAPTDQEARAAASSSGARTCCPAGS